MINLNFIRKYIPIILKLLSIAVILGFAFGVFFALDNIYNNGYLNHGFYNILLFDLRSYVTEYVLFFIVLSAGAILIYIVIAEIFHDKSLKEHYLLRAASYSLGLIFLLAVILYTFYPDIILFLKSTPLAESLHKLTKSKEETLWIFIFIASAVGLIFFMSSTYVLSKSNMVGTNHNSLIRFTNSGITKSLGVGLLALVLILNIFVYGYKKINSPTGPNILLISIDTLRADRLGAYGYHRDTSPNIDKLAEKGILFENTYSQAPWTLPAMATVHTSLYPTEHGATQKNLIIKKSLNTLAEYIKNYNYKTMAVTTHSFVDSKHGFSQGFDIFDEMNNRGQDDISSERITQKAIDCLSGIKDEKFFLWAHYFDPHAAYINHKEYSYDQNPNGDFPDIVSIGPLNENIDYHPGLVQYVSDIYDEEVLYTDRSVGKLIDALEILGLEEDTVIILTADHGEELFDRTRFGHGDSTYEELIHVPLIIYNPYQKELRGVRIEQTVETRNIPRTIVEVSGIKNSNFGGKNLFDMARDGADSQNYFAFSEGSSSRSKGTIKHAIIGKNWKLIKNLRENSFELYDLENDPGEKINLIDSEDPETEIMRNKLYSKLSEFKKERLVELEKIKLSKEDIDELKALGYIQ